MMTIDMIVTMMMMRIKSMTQIRECVQIYELCLICTSDISSSPCCYKDHVKLVIIAVFTESECQLKAWNLFVVNVWE